MRCSQELDKPEARTQYYEGHDLWLENHLCPLCLSRVAFAMLVRYRLSVGPCPVCDLVCKPTEGGERSSPPEGLVAKARKGG